MLSPTQIAGLYPTELPGHASRNIQTMGYSSKHEKWPEFLPTMTCLKATFLKSLIE
jgi:hypothetical protein